MADVLYAGGDGAGGADGEVSLVLAADEAADRPSREVEASRRLTHAPAMRCTAGRRGVSLAGCAGGAASRGLGPTRWR